MAERKLQEMSDGELEALFGSLQVGDRIRVRYRPEYWDYGGGSLNLAANAVTGLFQLARGLATGKTEVTTGEYAGTTVMGLSLSTKSYSFLGERRDSVTHIRLEALVSVTNLSRATPPPSKQASEGTRATDAAHEIDPEEKAALLEEADRMLEEYDRIKPCSRAGCPRDAIFHGTLCRGHALEEAGGPKAVPGGDSEVGELYAVVSHLTGRFVERLQTVGEFDPLSPRPISETTGPARQVSISLQLPSELPWQRLQLSLDVVGALLADQAPFMGMKLWAPGVEAGRANLFLELDAPARVTMLQSIHSGLWALANSIVRELLGEQGATETRCDVY